MIDTDKIPYETIRIESWRDFDDFNPLSPHCVYRGQGDESWSLQTTYERKQRVQDPMREPDMLRRFISQARIYMDDVLEDNDYVSWLSLMQHYGTGTRLFDVTRSRYVALFFALMGMIDQKCKKDGAVWVFKTYASNINFYNSLMTTTDRPMLDTREAPLAIALEEYKILGARFANEFIQSDWLMEMRPTIKDELVAKHSDRMAPFLGTGGVVEVVPRKLNKRMIAQAAEFLLPITLRRSFEENLFDGAKGIDGKRCVPEVVKLVIPTTLAAQCLKKLTEMNISYQTIYPDISGLAMSTNMCQ